MRHLLTLSALLMATCFLTRTSLARDVPSRAGKTENVIFVMTDGLRWQEVFRGARDDLIDNFHGAKDHAESDPVKLKERFSRPTPQERREALMPFVWGVVAR